MIFKQSIHSMMERSAKELLHAADLASPDYDENESRKRLERISREHEERTDISTFGSMLVKSGAAVTAMGVVMEVLPDYAETASRLTAASGLGAAAIGLTVLGYEKISQ